MSVEIRPCAHCSARFEPSRAQLAIERNTGCPLYCSGECYKEAKRKRSAAWWRSEAGREYNRNRYRFTHKED